MQSRTNHCDLNELGRVEFLSAARKQYDRAPMHVPIINGAPIATQQFYAHSVGENLLVAIARTVHDPCDVGCTVGGHVVDGGGDSWYRGGRCIRPAAAT